MGGDRHQRLDPRQPVIAGRQQLRQRRTVDPNRLCEGGLAKAGLVDDL
jgi:hypothetical protein